MFQSLKSSLMRGRQLGRLEDEVLRALWTRGDATVREFYAAHNRTPATVWRIVTADGAYIGLRPRGTLLVESCSLMLTVQREQDRISTLGALPGAGIGCGVARGEIPSASFCESDTVG